MRDEVTFIHAADLHLDAPFQGLSAKDERIGAELAEATYEAWRRIVDEALRRGVDFVVVAGDVHNAADLNIRAELRLREQAQRLDEAGIPLLLVHGNHDPLSARGAGISMPPNVHTFPAGTVERVEVVSEDGFVCAVYGRSFNTAAETGNFATGYRRDGRDTVAVGLLHSNVGSNPDYAPYAPCDLTDLREGRLDYWALGHIHKHEVLSQEPWAVYSGSPQGLNPNETGEHGCCVVTITRSGAVDVEHVALAPVGWVQRVVDVSEVADLDGFERTLNRVLDGVSAEMGRPCVLRVRLTGRTAVHHELSRPGTRGPLIDSMRSEHAAREPWVWLDRIDDHTAALLDVEALRDAPEFTGELVRLADEMLAGDGLPATVDEIAAPLREKLTGYEPSLSPEELLERARDRALDLLSPREEVR